MIINSSLPCFLVFSLLCAYGVHNSLGFRWCCKSEAEYNRCTILNSRTGADRSRLFKFNCVQGYGTDDCLFRIKNGGADLISVDAGDIFEHRRDVRIVAAEDSGAGDASYYAVSVVKRGQHPRLSMRNLGGSTSCHTGVGKSSGWKMPIGWLKNQGLNDNPFTASCAPGAQDPAYTGQVPGTNKAKWCALCIGDEFGQHVCDRDNDERYYGYSGAFRCMNEDRGQIAFVKHSIVPAASYDLYELLCPDGTRAPPSEWLHCTTGKVPAHAIIMRKDATQTDAQSVFQYLMDAKNSMDDFFSGNPSNLLLGSSTISFLPRYDSDVRTYLGEDYFCNIYALKYDHRGPGC